MDACINWVAEMVAEGHVYTELRVNEPWAQALRDGSDTVPGIDPALIGPARAGNENLIEFITASGSFFAVLSE